MKYINGCIIAFSMYSRIPMPKADWNEENMKYALCFFPWVGVVIGACFWLWGVYAVKIPVGVNLYGAVLTLIPLLVTGGIHLDGLLDTADALSSWQPKERRLEILKDSHAGAFAVLVCCAYFLAWFGLASELSLEAVTVSSGIFCFSRCLSGYGVTAFPCAKDSGLAAAFAGYAQKRRAGAVLLVEAVVCGLWLLWISPLAGGAAIGTALVTLLWYHRMSIQKFGGITGDLAGCFLQVCELAMLLAVVVVQKMR